MQDNELRSELNPAADDAEQDERVSVQPPEDETPEYDEQANVREYDSMYDWELAQEGKPKKKKSSAKPPRVGFRRRYNSWYSGMTRQEIFIDTAKTAGRWLIFTVLAYVYWLAMLLIMSIFLLNVWHVNIAQIFIYSGILCAICSVVYAYILVHRKFFY